MPNTAQNLPHFTPSEVAERRALARSFEASTIQEGYTPTEADRAFLARVVDGEITADQARAEIFARLRAGG